MKRIAFWKEGGGFTPEKSHESYINNPSYHAIFELDEFEMKIFPEELKNKLEGEESNIFRICCNNKEEMIKQCQEFFTKIMEITIN